MLDAIAHRGDETKVASSGPATIGLRSWAGRAGPTLVEDEAGRIVVQVGQVVPARDPVELARAMAAGAPPDGLDGAFALALWDPASATLTLTRDPFGQRSIYYMEVGGTLWFATELKQLLTVPGLPVALDPIAVHKYLTFSFVPGEATPIAGVRRVPPGHVLTWRAGVITTRPWFELVERIAPIEQGEAVKRLRQLAREAVGKRLSPGVPVGLYLSGGIDSSAVGVWLKALGADVRALTLDFGARSVEREEATAVARHLDVPLEVVPVDAAEIGRLLHDVLWKLDLPFGDPVTAPHWLLGRAARARGLTTVWNGEGGDQLFGGWTSKPMVAAAVYGGSHADEDAATPEQQYLKSYHKFYGLEGELYGPALRDVIEPGIRRRVIARFLGEDGERRASTFLNRVRLTDLSLKGSQNILPRAERMAAAHGLDLRMPLFDRALAEWSFTLPTSLKLHGASEKHVLKLAMQGKLPDAIIWRRKFGMSVPVTDWVLGPLKPLVDELLSDASVKARGLFQPAFVRALRSGQDVASETRKRRLGERLWALLVLEVWCRRFVDGRGGGTP